MKLLGEIKLMCIHGAEIQELCLALSKLSDAWHAASKEFQSCRMLKQYGSNVAFTSKQLFFEIFCRLCKIIVCWIEIVNRLLIINSVCVIK